MIAQRMQKKYTVIDLFSGAGGMTLGFQDDRFCGRFQSILAVDHDDGAIASFRENFGPHGVSADIIGWLKGNRVPTADIVIGGPPCQGFSLLNRNRTGDGRRSLWKPFMKVVRLSQAKAFVIENVRDLYRSSEAKAIERTARRMGFSTCSWVLNSANYGVPQVRHRTFIVGIRGPGNHFCPAPEPTHSESGSMGLVGWLTVRNAIANLRNPIGTLVRKTRPPYDLHFGRNPTPVSVERYRAVPPGGNRFDLQANAPHITPQCWLNKKSGGTDLFGRLWWDRPSVTIRTEFYKPEKGRYLHPEQDRPITHREAARLMGFPDDFRFCGTKVAIAKQIGNAVPPGLAAAVAGVVATILDSRASTSAA